MEWPNTALKAQSASSSKNPPSTDEGISDLRRNGMRLRRRFAASMPMNKMDNTMTKDQTWISQKF